jgi:hypothetical protein
MPTIVRLLLIWTALSAVVSPIVGHLLATGRRPTERPAEPVPVPARL